MATVTELLQEAEHSINCSDSAKLDGEILLCDVMQFDRSKIYSDPEQSIPDDKLIQFQLLIEKRRQGYPIAHLTGKKEFWSLELTISRDTLIPRPETECLVETALQMIPECTTFNILDLGTGSGAIAIAIASERPNCKILATDINKNALITAQQNVKLHQLKNIQFLQSHWYKNIPAQSFDMIVSNPPYIKKNDEHLLQGDVRFESELALVAGADGMDAINLIIENAKPYLADEAHLLTEHGYNQKILVQDTFLQNDFKQVTTIKDFSGQDRITFGQIIS